MSGKSKMTSIARKLNASFWRKRLWDILLTDLLLAILLCGSFLFYCEQNTYRSLQLQAESEERESTGTESEEDPSAQASETEREPLPALYRRADRCLQWEHVRGQSGILWFVKDSSVGIFKENVPETDAHKSRMIDYVITAGNGQEYRYSYTFFLRCFLPAAAVLLVFQGIHLFFALFHTSEIRRKLKPLNDLAMKAEEISTISFDPVKFAALEHAIENVSPDGPEQEVHTGDKDLQSIEIALNNLLHHMKESQKQQARFVSDASHELRTPIAVIQGYVNMLDRWGKEDEEVLTESIEALKNESEHMKELIEQLLFLARGDSGRNTLNPVHVDLNTIVEDVFEESMMIDSTHKYEMRPLAGAWVYGDVAMLKQSIRIFVQNAVKYSPAGGTIQFSVQADADTVSYRIQDEGVGMAASEVEHIFERFYRSDQARNSETGGSGLGLSIAKWIIDAHDGVIEVLSRPEFGTRFTVRFKKAQEEIVQE